MDRKRVVRIASTNITENIVKNNTFLLPRDILEADDHLIGLKFGKGTLHDMNHLKNKRIRSVADLLQDQFGQNRKRPFFQTKRGGRVIHISFYGQRRIES